LQRPPRVSHFIGRSNELKLLQKELQPGRVIVLWGPGGVGKSALAAEVIWTMAPENKPPKEFPDGIIYYSFYNQPKVDLALEAIIRAFRVEPEPTLRDAAQRVLSNKRALLLLDGTEVLTSSQGNLETILQVTGSCGVLITSRSRKDAEDDWLEILPLEQQEAVDLLRSWGEDFAANSKAVHEICTLVGRLPLAVRLVGRYLKETGESTREFLEWLRKAPLEALDQGKHQSESVPVLLKRSLGQVGESAHKVLSIVGLLALAPFDRKDLTAALKISELDLKRPLNELVNCGLLLRRGKYYEVSHTLVHTYAREKIIPSPELLTNLATYYAGYANKQRKKGADGYKRLDDKREHILEVLTKCINRSHWETGKFLYWEIKDYLFSQGYLTELITISHIGVELSIQLEDRDEEATWLGNSGLANLALGQMEEAFDYLNAALKIFQESGYRQGEASAFGNIGLFYLALGRIQHASKYLNESLNVHRAVGYRKGEASALGNLGLVYLTLDRMENAFDYFTKSLNIHRKIGFRQGEASVLGNLGLAYLASGRIRDAYEYLSAVLKIYRGIGYRRGEASALGALGLTYLAIGRIEDAYEYFNYTLRIYQEIGYHRGKAAALGALGLAHLTLGEIKDAVTFQMKALEIYWEIGFPQGEASVLSKLGLVYRNVGEVNKAMEHHREALGIYKQIGDRQGQAYNLVGLGLACSHLSKIDETIKYFQDAYLIYREIGFRQGAAYSLAHLGLFHRSLGNERKANELLHQALAIDKNISNRKDKAFSLEKLDLTYIALGQIKNSIEYYQPDYFVP
jgi:tetratricopeptide (TPR) repeat protein